MSFDNKLQLVLVVTVNNDDTETGQKTWLVKKVW